MSAAEGAGGGAPPAIMAIYKLRKRLRARGSLPASRDLGRVGFISFHKLTSSAAGEVSPLEGSLGPRLQCGSASERSAGSVAALLEMGTGLSGRLGRSSPTPCGGRSLVKEC